MTKNPYLNACTAAAYIIGIVLLISTFSKPNTPDTFFTPMVVLSLLTLSAAFMAYTFFYRPVVLFVEGQKREAIEFFTKTLVSFAVLTALILLVNFAAR